MVNFIHNSNNVSVADRARAKNYVLALLSPHFDAPIHDRVGIIFEVEKFDWREDESLHNQATGKAHRVIEVLWDGVYVCDLVENITTGKRLLVKFLKSFTDLYVKGLIVLIKPTAEEQQLRDSELKKLLKDKDKEEEAKFSTDGKGFDSEEDYLGAKIVEEVWREKKEEEDKEIDKKFKKFESMEVLE